MFSESERSEYDVIDFIGDFASQHARSNARTCTTSSSTGTGSEDADMTVLIGADEAVAFLRDNQ